jgi:hypothetical protein
LRKKSKLKVFVDACDLVEYVLKITANEKVFKPEQSAVTDKIKAAAIDIARFTGAPTTYACARTRSCTPSAGACRTWP